MKVVEVALAHLFDPEGRVLLTQRPSYKHFGGLWEFPGGKIEADETSLEAIVRELREELLIEVTPTFALEVYHYPMDEQTTLSFHPVICEWQSQIITLTEHTQSVFVGISELRCYDLAPPDFQAVDLLEQYLIKKQSL